MIAGEYTLSSDLAEFQWGSLGPLVVNAGATLHVGYSFYVRNFSGFKCILWILNLERAYVNTTVNVKYNLHECKEQHYHRFYLQVL